MIERGTVSARSGLRLRDSAQDGAVLDVLPQGQEVEILGRETWLRVRVGREEGFVLADYIDPARPHVLDLPLDNSLPATGHEAITFNAPNFHSERPIRIHRDFQVGLERVSQLAATKGVELFVTSSLRPPKTPVSGAIVAPARFSNHHAGHAIDMNVLSRGQLYNSKTMSSDRFEDLPEEVRDFLLAVDAEPGLRWGGRFSNEDPVHIDDGLNGRNRASFVTKVQRFWA